MTTTSVRTILTIFRPGLEPVRQVIGMSEQPGLAELKSVVRTLINDADLEHVAVLHDGARADMFVDEQSAVKGLPRFEAATKIYRHNWVTQHPENDPETLPAIYGNAVLFDRIVWR